MIEAKFHLLQIEEKVAPPDPIIAPELCLGERPEAFNAVDMVPLPCELARPVVDPVVSIAIREEAVVAPERVRVNGAPLRYFLLDDEAQDRAGHVGYGTGVDLAVPLKKAEYRHFSCRTPAAVPFAVAAEVTLVHLDFTGERRFAFTRLGNRLSDTGVNPLGAVAVNAELAGSASCGNLKGEMMDELSDGSVRKVSAFDEFLCHDMIIRKVENLD